MRKEPTSEIMYVKYRDENRTRQALGVQPALGRWFSESEHTLGAARLDPAATLRAD